MIAAVVVAAGSAGIFGLVEQIVAIPSRRRLPRSWKAAGFLALRVLADVGTTAGFTYFARFGLGIPLRNPWEGLEVALFVVLGVRSAFFSPGDASYGLQTWYSRFTKWISNRIVNLSNVQSSGAEQSYREQLTQLNTPPWWVAERVSYHLDHSGIKGKEKTKIQTRIDRQRGDVGSSQERLEALMRLADQCGGEDLLDDIVQRAAEQSWLKEKGGPDAPDASLAGDCGGEDDPPAPPTLRR